VHIDAVSHEADVDATHPSVAVATLKVDVETTRSIEVLVIDLNNELEGAISKAFKQRLNAAKFILDGLGARFNTRGVADGGVGRFRHFLFLDEKNEDFL